MSNRVSDRVINLKVYIDRTRKKMCSSLVGVKLNFGSGKDIRSDFINLDISREFHPDIVCTEMLPFADNSVDGILARHVIEHISDTIQIMNELWRVCKDGATVIIEVPHQSSRMAFADPTHKKIFNEESFKYFCSNGEHYWIHKSYGIHCDFTMVNQKIIRDNRWGIIIVKLRANKKREE